MQTRFLVNRHFKTAELYEGTLGIKERLLGHGFVVVMHHGGFQGILTASDLVKAPFNLVADCIHPRPVVTDDQDIEAVLKIMTETQQTVLPVFSADVFVGVIQRADIVDYLVERQQELERMVDKRTKELQTLHRHLAASQKMEAIGRIASGIAHDFNNILSIILGNTELVLEGLAPGDTHTACLQDTRTACLRAKELIQHILAYSRKKAPPREYQQVARIIDEAVCLIRAALPAAVTLTTAISPDKGILLANTVQIHQVLLNLCSNAVQAMDGRGALEISIGRESLDPAEADALGVKAGEFFRISVADDGCGIPEDTINRIFDPYYTTKAPGEGTGLGLSIVYSIVKSHDGAVKATSDGVCGSRFDVFLPISIQSEAVDLPAARAAAPVPMRVVVIDDESAVAGIIGSMLKRMGCSVDCFSDERDAMNHLKTFHQQYQLIITDMSMPHFSGIEIAKQVYRFAPTLPVIIATGDLIDVENLRRESANIKSVMGKPFSREDLAVALATVADTKIAPPQSLFQP